MSARVSVGTSYADATFGWAVVAAGGGAVAAAVFLFAKIPGLAITSGVVALVGAAVAVGRGVYIARNQRWLSPTDTGFVLTDRRGEFEFADEQVSDLATWPRTVFANGVPKAIRRAGSFVITAGEAAATFPFRYDYPLDRPDPLGGMLDRVFEKLVARASAGLDRGEELAGAAWVLTRHDLVIGRGPDELTLPLRDIAAVDIADRRVCVWAAGKDDAALRVAADSPNALVMGRLLQDRVTPAADGGGEAGGLGRVVFERNSGVTGVNLFAGWSLVLIAALFALGGVGAMANRQEGIGLVLMLGGSVGAVSLAGYLWYKRVDVFRCHTRGVARTTRRGVASLKYADCGGFTYSATRVYVNGAYSGTRVAIRFDPLTPQSGPVVRYDANVKNADEELDKLREFVSGVVASHMLRRLTAGETVPWTRRMTFTPQGLLVRPAGGLFSAGGEPRLIPYPRVGGIDLREGHFLLSERGSEKWDVREPVNQDNFFPGLALLQTLLAAPRANPAPPGG